MLMEPWHYVVLHCVARTLAALQALLTKIP